MQHRARQTHTHHITLPRSHAFRISPGAGARAAPRRRPTPQHRHCRPRHRGTRARTTYARTTLAPSSPPRAPRARARARNTPHTPHPCTVARSRLAGSRRTPPLPTTLRVGIRLVGRRTRTRRARPPRASLLSLVSSQSLGPRTTPFPALALTRYIANRQY